MELARGWANCIRLNNVWIWLKMLPESHFEVASSVPRILRLKLPHGFLIAFRAYLVRYGLAFLAVALPLSLIIAYQLNSERAAAIAYAKKMLKP